MRIDFVTTFGLVEGFPSFPEAVLARSLAADGHTVRALTYYAKSSAMIDSHHTVIDGTDVRRIRRKGIFAPGSLRWIARSPPDVAHLHHLSNRLTAMALPAYHARRVPVLFSPYGILHDPVLVADTDRPLASPLHTDRIQRSLFGSVRALGPKSGGFVWALHRPLFVADAVHAMSEHERRVLINDLGVPDDRVHVIPLGIDPAPLTAPTTVERSERPTVLFLGQTKYRKGWDVLLRAVPYIVRAVPDVRFIFAGHTGRDRDDFDALINTSGIAMHIEVRGRVDEAEKVRLLRSSWILTLPARYEGFGLPLVEAMFCGTPVVTTDVPACNEIVQDGETGLVVPADNPSALASALVRLLADNSLRDRLSSAGQRAAYEQYAAPVIARRFARLYASLATGRI